MTDTQVAEPTVIVARPLSKRSASAGDRLERMTPGAVEARAKATGEPTIYGHGATFNSLTVINDWFGSYAERVAPGAFTKTLQDGADVRCLFNHDPNFVIGRTKSGTLTLEEDDVGLAYEATPPDTQWARDLQTTMKRGDVTGSSFGFRVIRDKWTTVLDPDGDGKTDMIDCRTLIEVQLYDVSPVTFPAYEESDSAIRSSLAGAGFDFDVLARVLFRKDHGLALSTRDHDQFRALLDHLRLYLPAESTATVSAPGQPIHAETVAEPTEPTLSGHSASSLARLYRLEQQIEADKQAQKRRSG